MKCILVFDQLNDVIFSKWDKNFVAHVEKLAHVRGLDGKAYKQDDGELNMNFIVQLFAPIVTSQRFMSSQFGNSYASIQCQDGLNMVFEEYMGYLFVHFGFEDVYYLKRMLGICISIVQHLCGPDVSMLRDNQSRSILVVRLLETWENLVRWDQAMLLESLEQLSINSNLSMISIKFLKEATEKIKSILDQPQSHALIFVENKFLALYSSRNARELCASDMLFLSLLSKWSQEELGDVSSQAESSDEYYSPDSSPQAHRKLTITEISNGKYDDVLLLSGSNFPAVSPYVTHISLIADGISILLLHQTQHYHLSLYLNEAFEAVNLINSVSACSTEIDGVKRGMEQLESAMKKIFEAIKKLRHTTSTLESCIKVMHVKWDLLKRQWSENNVTGNMVGVNSCSYSLGLCLRDLLQVTVHNKGVIHPNLDELHSIAQRVTFLFRDFTSFLQVKALKNFTLGSSTSQSAYKYIQDFPGLVHFMFLDRINHRIIAPSLGQPSTLPLTKKTIWSMIKFSRIHLQAGHFALMWRDTALNYSFYLWFEDDSGSQLKTKVSPSQVVKSLPPPGVFRGDFYQRLIKTCFPKMAASKIRCYELYCFHLGLATSSSILEQARRIASTIWEVTGLPNHPVDLLTI